MKFTVTAALAPASYYIPIALAAEQSGWDGVTMPDSPFYPEHVSANYPYTDNGLRPWTAETPWVDPLVAIPAMAAVTERLHFYTSVLKLPIRNPLFVGKTVGSLAAMFPGRIALGVGVSWIPEEFTWCGSDYATRGGRTDEAIEIVRALTGGGMVEYHGEYYDFERLQMSPAPERAVPIYVGGRTRPALRRAARLCDGWISAPTTEADLIDTIAQLKVLRREAGRDRLPFEIIAFGSDVFDFDGCRRLEDAGVTEVAVSPWLRAAGDPSRLAVQTDAIARFADEVIAKMRD